MASATASPRVQGIAAGRSLARSARLRPAPVRTRRPSPARWRITTSAGLLDALEAKVPQSSTAEDVDEKLFFDVLRKPREIPCSERLPHPMHNVPALEEPDLGEAVADLAAARDLVLEDGGDSGDPAGGAAVPGVEAAPEGVVQTGLL